MERRKALRLTASMVGGTIVGSEVFLSGCSTSEKPGNLFSQDEIMLLDEIGETILPHTDKSPGAKAAQIGRFMTNIVQDCYDENDRKTFKSGIREVIAVAQEKYDQGFAELPMENRLNLLTLFDQQAAKELENDQVHFFTMMKQLTIWGYFSSETGATKALRFNPIPGRYEGCLPYHPGEPAWA